MSEPFVTLRLEVTATDKSVKLAVDTEEAARFLLFVRDKLMYPANSESSAMLRRCLELVGYVIKYGKHHEARRAADVSYQELSEYIQERRSDES